MCFVVFFSCCSTFIQWTGIYNWIDDLRCANLLMMIVGYLYDEIIWTIFDRLISLFHPNTVVFDGFRVVFEYQHGFVSYLLRYWLFKWQFFPSLSKLLNSRKWLIAHILSLKTCNEIKTNIEIKYQFGWESEGKTRRPWYDFNLFVTITKLIRFIYTIHTYTMLKLAMVNMQFQPNSVNNRVEQRAELICTRVCENEIYFMKYANNLTQILITHRTDTFFTK